MSETSPGPTGISAAASLTQYRCCRITGEHTVNTISDADGQRPIGIVQNDPASGEAVEVGIYGHTVRAEYGGNVTAGDKLACDDSGRLVTDVEVLNGTAVDLHHMAIALEDGAISEIHDVLALAPQIVGKE